MKKYLQIVLLWLMFSLSALPAIAQPDFDDEAEDVPLDNGAGMLLIAAAAFGVKKARTVKFKFQ